MRDSRKNKQYFEDFKEDILADIEDDMDYLEKTKDIRPKATVNLPWNIFAYNIDLARLSYSQGLRISDLLEYVENSYHWLQKMHSNGSILESHQDKEFFAIKLELTLDVLYKYVRWLTFALATDFSRDKLVQVLDLMGQSGVDKFFDLIVKKLGDVNRKVGTKPRCPIIFKGLVSIIEAAPEDRSKLMSAYLENWYQDTLEEGLNDDHKDEDFYYKGYWCYEAALVVMLWNIDDSSFRNNPYYPKDLVRKL
jgi:hypothetical protein